MPAITMSLIMLAGSLLVSLPRKNQRMCARLVHNSQNPNAAPRDGPSRTSAFPAWVKAMPRPLRAKISVLGTSPAPPPLVVAADIDLFAQCVRAGLSIEQATKALAQVAEPETAPYWQEIAALLAVGVPADRAWMCAEEVGGLGELARAIVMSGSSGTSIAAACPRIVDRLKSDASAAATAAAERAGVFISIPLAVCFLPAFIVLGLTPVIIGLGSQFL